MLHHIRRSVLDKLATVESMRYAEIKPAELDGNVFNYHLKALIADRLVHKTDSGYYSLTHLGRDYIIHRYEDPTKSAHTIFLIVLRQGSKYLLRRRDVQPLIGYAGFVHGEPEAGIPMLQTAQQRLETKTGITGVDLQVVGSALITQYKDDELQSYSHAVILYGETTEDIQIESDATGHNFWADINSTEKLLPSCTDIMNMIETNQTWLDRSYTLE